MAVTSCPECGKLVSMSAEGCPRCGYRPDQAKATGRRQGWTAVQARPEAWLLRAAGAFVIYGCVMAWATFSVSGVRFEEPGTGYPLGIVTMLAGAVMLVAGFTFDTVPLRMTGWGLAVVPLAMGLYGLVNPEWMKKDLLWVDVGPGLGVWLILAGAAFGIWSAGLHWYRNRNTTAPNA